MNWFEKLNSYFPIEEMKAKEQLNALLAEKSDIYFKDEREHHILMYAEFDSFIFIDFLWVSGKSRGKGIGHQVFEKLKAKNKPIILEVEPINNNDLDTVKRLRFYKREGFKHAASIVYQFQAFITNTETQLEILYWTKNDRSEKTIFENMKTVYEKIHTYKVKEIYGFEPKEKNEVIHFNKNRNVKRLFQN